MDFSRYIPPEAIVALGIITILVITVGAFHISVH